MLISTKGRYALRVLIDLAEHQSDAFLSLRGIAQRQEISEKYLESIIRMLVKAKVLESLRGKGGGYLSERLRMNIQLGAFCGLQKSHWHLYPVWSKMPIPAPVPGIAVPFRFGRDWIRSSMIIWKVLPSPI